MRLWTSLRRLFAPGAGDAPTPVTTTYAGDSGLVEITTPSGPGQPPSEAEAEAEQHQFIVSNWAELAAAAYDGFRRHGIGAVVVEARAGASATDAFRTHELAYAPGVGRRTQAPPPSAAPGWLDEQLQTYEPLEAGLFLFRTEGAQRRHAPRPYHAAGTPAPPQALREARAPFN